MPRCSVSSVKFDWQPQALSIPKFILLAFMSTVSRYTQLTLSLLEDISWTEITKYFPILAGI